MVGFGGRSEEAQEQVQQPQHVCGDPAMKDTSENVLTGAGVRGHVLPGFHSRCIVEPSCLALLFLCSCSFCEHGDLQPRRVARLHPEGWRREDCSCGR